jgi:bisphosphoglycerate-dependent phosphoglycerate mutase
MRAWIFLLPVFLLITAGCGKNDKESQIKIQQEQELIESGNDTSSLTPAESFAAALTQEILNDETEVELESFLAEKVYPLVSGSKKVTIDKISSSLYLIKYFNENTEKNILIQKYYIPAEDSFSFEITETNTNSIKQFVR